MKKLFITIVIAASVNITFAQTHWETLNTNGMPEKRHECAFVEVNDKFYLVGGRGMKPVDEYNPETKTWRTMATPPVEMHHFQALAYDNKVYVIGALSGGYPDEKPIPNVYIFDPAKNAWTKGAAIPEGRRRGAAGVVYHNGLVYVVCGIVDGHNGNYVPWMDSWNPETGEWKQLADAPRPRDHFQAAIVDGKLYAAGGRTTSASTNQVMELTIPEVDCYDPDKDKWKTIKKDLPTLRAGTASVAFKNQLIVLGGESGTQKPAHNEVEVYSVDSKQWSAFNELNQGRHGTQAILYNNKLYIAAGSGNRGGGPELTSIEVMELK